MITGNKGEWSEIYALFKLLGDKELHPGNSEIKKLENAIQSKTITKPKSNNQEKEYPKIKG